MPTNPPQDAKIFDTNLDPKRGGHDATVGIANTRGLVIDIWGIHCQQRVTFKAILESYKDEFSTQLESFTFIGHPQPYRKQKTIERSTSVGIAIPAYSVSEAKENLKAISKFVKMLHPLAKTTTPSTPSQSPTYFVPAGGDPIFKVKFLNLLSDGGQSAGASPIAGNVGLTGYIDNLSYDFVLDAEGGGFLGSHDTGEAKGYVYPKLVRMSFVFYPFESESPLWALDDQGSVSFTRSHFPYDHKPVNKDGDHVFASAVIGEGDNASGASDSHAAKVAAALGDTASGLLS